MFLLPLIKFCTRENRVFLNFLPNMLELLQSFFSISGNKNQFIFLYIMFMKTLRKIYGITYLIFRDAYYR